MNNGNAPSLKGKTAVVTGASSGIGRAIAEKLGAAGAHVYLAGRTSAAMEDSKKRIESAGGRATPVVTDVRDTAQVQALVERAVDDTGRLDVMVNNAGVSHPSAIIDADPSEWRDMFETNVLALLAGCQAAVRAMRKTGAEGHIVNISSVAALRPDSGVYGSTKHAVNCISRTLRNELEGDSIRVVTIMPGAIATNFGRNFEPAVIAPLVRVSGVEVDIKRGERLPDEVFEKMPAAMRQTLGSPEDVANAVLFAVSQPIDVNVAEIVVRPPKQLAL
ncbi:MAG TPA: SDR family oxidoreductase [Dehalococcoidia bacterium]|jgi:NADP-dependent 3-hydroxy acid dehydrogenase YdfG|nr:SDR family oxidoreductase [Dehalococcoidia bacterium]